jgi:hypothetical protein
MPLNSMSTGKSFVHRMFQRDVIYVRRSAETSGAAVSIKEPSRFNPGDKLVLG